MDVCTKLIEHSGGMYLRVLIIPFFAAMQVSIEEFIVLELHTS